MCLGILGIVLLATSVSAWTPGLKIEKKKSAVARWGWKNSTESRSQDNFTCPANLACFGIVNITFNGTMWAGPKDSQGYRSTFALHQAKGDISVVSHVHITCCLKSRQFMYLNQREREMQFKNCSNPGLMFKFPVKNVNVIICVNATSIQNRTWWAQDLVFIDINASQIDPGHIKKLPSTCEKVGTHAQKTVLITQVTFPPNNRQCMPRRKRAWYDTLLGGYGALTGTLNGFDVETLANRLHSTGSKINDGLTLQVRWMPTIYNPAKISAGVDTIMNQLINASVSFTEGFNINVTRFVNWTICTMQTIYEQQPKGTMQTILEKTHVQIAQQLLLISHWSLKI